jgi:hypothetical protein
MGILTDDMKRVVREQRLGFVASVCPDGTPNLSPKGTTTVWDDDHLAFADIRSPNTVRNLRANPAVEVNVVDPIVRKGYRFKGIAQVVNEGELFEQALLFFDRELNVTRDRIEALVLIRVLEARPLISPAYDTGLSEEQVIERWERWQADLRALRQTNRAL